MHLKVQLKTSPVFIVNWQALMSAAIIYIINQGGTRSGKTYSILQCILMYCLHNTGKIIDVVRKTHRELSETILVDWHEILTDAGLMDRIPHNKTRHIYHINGNTIRFIGIDKAQKRKGSKRDLLYINEANGLTLEDWIQLTIRLTGKVILDFNPSEEFWAHTELMEKEPSHIWKLIHSTYLDNYDFLGKDQIARIENLIRIDDYYYKVYTLGILAELKGKIYSNYEIIDDEAYEVIDAEEVIYGIDWGYEHAMVLVEIKIAQEVIYERELFCASYQYDDDLFDYMDEIGVSMDADIYADPAYPASIRKGKERGYSIHKAKKDVKPGIRFCQGLRTKVCRNSINLIRQKKRYKWKQTADGKVVVGEPVKIDDDTQDAERYALYTHLKKRIGD